MKISNPPFSVEKQKSPWVRYMIPLLLISLCTGLLKWLFPHIDLVNLAMIYLLANVMITIRYGQGPAILTTILSVGSFDFFFVPPYFTFSVVDVRYWVTFLVMFVVTLVTSRLAIQSRLSANKALSAEIEVQKEKLISSLLSSVSHDLRTPLASISGASSTLLEKESDISLEDKGTLLQMINDESIRLNRLVEKILQITKIESGSIHLRKEMHSLEEIIGSVLNRLDNLLEGRKITTEILDNSSVPLDELLIEQVLTNLLENALQYTPPNLPIDIRVYKENYQVWLEILDKGSGISKQDQPHIFEKFYRGNNKDKWGSGLGLAICQGIIKVHQGQIGMRERADGGSIFYFSLPLQTSSPNSE